MRNVHGLEEGWAWLARFLNAIPANGNSAVALVAFFSTAGFALHRKYKSHFRKLLDVINQHFLGQLKKVKDDPKVSIKMRELQEYIESRKFLVEPEGSRLQTSLLSNALTPGA
ncbi:mRNA export factor GLE1-like protein [Drosera capensis]